MAVLTFFMRCAFPDGSTADFASKLPEKTAANDLVQLIGAVSGSDELNSGADLRITDALIHNFFARFHERLDAYEAEAIRKLR